MANGDQLLTEIWTDTPIGSVGKGADSQPVYPSQEFVDSYNEVVRFVNALVVNALIVNAFLGLPNES